MALDTIRQVLGQTAMRGLQERSATGRGTRVERAVRVEPESSASAGCHWPSLPAICTTGPIGPCVLTQEASGFRSTLMRPPWIWMSERPVGKLPSPASRPEFMASGQSPPPEANSPLICARSVVKLLHVAPRPEYTKAYDELILRLAPAKGGAQ